MYCLSLQAWGEKNLAPTQLIDLWDWQECRPYEINRFVGTPFWVSAG